MGASVLTDEQRAGVKELARRRVFLFLYVLVAIVFPLTALGENDILLHALDDYLGVVFSVVAIVALVVYWRKPYQGVRTANKIALIMG